MHQISRQIEPRGHLSPARSEGGLGGLDSPQQLPCFGIGTLRKIRKHRQASTRILTVAERQGRRHTLLPREREHMRGV